VLKEKNLYRKYGEIFGKKQIVSSAIWAIGNRQWAIGNRQWAMGNGQKAKCNKQ
jgi:hypothetical protein